MLVDRKTTTSRIGWNFILKSFCYSVLLIKKEIRSIYVMYLLFTYKNTIIFLISTFFSLFYFFPPFRRKHRGRNWKILFFWCFWGPQHLVFVKMTIVITLWKLFCVKNLSFFLLWHVFQHFQNAKSKAPYFESFNLYSQEAVLTVFLLKLGGDADSKRRVTN